ncbi:MAG: leucine-rich repeat protein [Clostridia bacterium]|nr:leucine-rich repeat protein [Clostridia bacterium]
MTNKKLMTVILLIIALTLTCVACASRTNGNIETVSEKTDASWKAVDMDIDVDISKLLEQNNLQLNTTSSVFSADDKLWVIVETEGGSVADYYLDNNIGMSFKEFAVSDKGNEIAGNLVAVQDLVKNWISDAQIEIEYKYSYTSIINGFAAYITYSDLALIEALPYVNRVIISEEYEQPETQSYEELAELVRSTGIYENNSKYQGEGMLIAVLDNAFDTKHTAFSTQLTDVNLTKDNVAEFVSDIYGVASLGKTFTADNIYLSSKIPFVFDYGDKDADVSATQYSITYYSGFHGTHVAGIVGGDDNVITGVAPKAQLALMKVFYSDQLICRAADLVAALGDCALLGVDAVNMSLGSPAGFTYERLADAQYINEIYNKLDRLGVLICSATGNYRNAGDAYIGGDTYASNPDSGLIDSPASYSASFAVASVNNSKDEYIKSGDDTVFYMRAFDANSKSYDITSLILGNDSKKTLEVVVIDGVGAESDYEGIDVTGKAVLVTRGDISFEEKHAIAASKGAIACIIGNNANGVVAAQIQKMLIPTISIMQYDAEMLKSKAVNGVFEVSFSTNYNTVRMSSFSTWGPLSDLTLKPDITAPGESVYSAMPNGYKNGLYAYLNGTSMSTPNLTGIITCVKQYLATVYPQATEVQLRDMSYQLIQSTAIQAIDASGNSASVRNQGAGVACLENALNSKAYLTVTGTNRAKLELGDDKNKDGIYTLNFKVVNMSSDVLSYTIDVETLTETLNLDGVTLAERSYLLDKGTVEVVANGYANGVLTVAANATVKVKIIIRLADEEKAYLDESFVNGMYVEGFARLLNADEEGVDLSIPFLAFYGDWTQAPIFDATAYDSEDALIYGSGIIGFGYLNGSSSYVMMGNESYLFNTPEGYEANEASYDKIALTVDQSGISKIYTVYITLFRNVSYLEYNIMDSETGYVYYSAYGDNVSKTYYTGSNIIVVGHRLWIDTTDYDLLNNQTLVMTIDAYLDVKGEYNHSQLSFPIYIDYEKPELLDVEVREEDEHTHVDLTVYDNHYFESYLLLTSHSSLEGIVSALDSNQYPVKNWTKAQNGVLTLDISNYIPLMNNGEFYIALQDCAHNQSIYYIGNFSKKDEENGTDALAINPDDIDAEYMESIGVKLIHDEGYDALMSEIIAGYKESLTQNEEFSTEGAVVNTADEHKFTVNGGGQLIKYEGPGGDVVIPDDIGVVAIMGINDVFRNRKDITSVTLPSTCIALADNAFQGCSIEYCYMPETMRSIGAYSFYQSGLRKFDMPESVISTTGKWCFALNSQLEEFTFSDGFTGTVPDYFLYGTAVKELYIPDGVTIVRYGAFLSSLYMTKMRMSPNVTLIYNNAIGQCISLEEFNFADLTKNTWWGTSAFDYADSYAGDIIIPDPGTTVSLSIRAFGILEKAKSFKCYASLGNILGMGLHAPEMESIIFYKNVGNIQQCFLDYTKMTNLEFHGDVGIIGGGDLGDRSFSKLQISSVDFYGNVNAITGVNFSNCPNLEKVVFHKNVGTISGYSFGNCTKLKYFSISEDNTYMYFDEETKIMYNSGRTKMYAPSSWDYDGVLVIPETVKTLEIGQFGTAQVYMDYSKVSDKLVTVSYAQIYKTFYDADIVETKPLLKGVVLPSGLTSIPAFCFAGFSGMEYVDFNGANLSSIGQYAFTRCGLKEVLLPTNLVSIADHAFYDATRLESITLPERLTTIKDYAFQNTALKSLYIPSSVVTLDPITVLSGVNTLEQITVGANSLKFKAVDNALLSKDESILYKYSTNNISQSFVVPEAVKDISEYAFYSSSYLKNIDFKNVEYIGKYAFCGSALESVNIADCMLYIDTRAFAEMDIETLTICGGAEVFDYSYVFYNTDIANVVLEGEQQFFAINNGLLMNKAGNIIYDCLTSIEGVLAIPEGVTRIMPFAFQNETGITELVLPSTLKSIGAATFYGCTGLTKITFNSEKAPRFESEYDYEAGAVNYCNFVTDLANVPEEGLAIEIVCGNDATYYSYLWKLYFGIAD